MPDVGSLDRHLRFAIAHKRLIEVQYGGRRRLIEPHDYGMKNGTPKLLVYQLRRCGAAPGPAAQGWRMLDVAKIAICAVSESTFAGSRGHDAQQHFVWDELFARVT
jgi:hypothetical protein